MRLGVNIDHVATLRQARRTFEPSPVFAALIAQQAGADQITLHLREDRRHIQDRDLELIKELVIVPVNLEMAPTHEMREIALRVKPDRVTLVPEKREEITTEGGLDVKGMEDYLRDYIKPLKSEGVEVSLFIDPEEIQVEASHIAGADAIELHTGTYANLWNEHRFSEAKDEIERLRKAGKQAKEFGLRVYAGHGLTYQNVKGILELSDIIEELNIGHSIIANSVIFGLERAVREMIETIRGGRNGI
ncbi:pyridoxine 5-phosphate synthase [Hydrogenivirga caldilitoris]|uniref:Pyridoxine 5'-phosphate synthase n=1 Tax=Hydrogenivirga caldilitoris TaxID=246264 RepID=A0A497XQU2_9AQUI|nr:pyridoxine 5'-phosphate synthase [Hydrogenivirga caldilitoris]RLJ71357.1 pyridoxine 5-phosphate synthase [Hydrogenivirga caldilitoris]